jgi:hypothetical protein
MLSSHQLKLLSKVFQPSFLSLKKGIYYVQNKKILRFLPLRSSRDELVRLDWPDSGIIGKPMVSAYLATGF